ncbi:hypothetical protein HMPREF3107_06825 [Neisseria sp. HMSC31F04]|uniref:hypothetical protein n=1 Tax=Neisseria sp. HMSC31F04 TaxID=1581075 RepID=UPI0008A63A8C|nr:hypothetical protein [Neisseria sp. HMSC31F04]OFT01064.1 hypothetical protein HMPREF3107_06825 [Neisseria sp. HMSC31F04]
MQQFTLLGIPGTFFSILLISLADEITDYILSKQFVDNDIEQVVIYLFGRDTPHDTVAAFAGSAAIVVIVAALSFAGRGLNNHRLATSTASQ